MSNVLIVEDELHINKIYAEKLKLEGFDVMSTQNGKEALGFLKTTDIGLVLLDIMLPGIMNGFELLEIIKKDTKLKNIPVVVITNLDSEKEQAKKYEVDDYLVKSDTSLEEMVNVIRKHIK